jgi:hypothetical protein
MVCDISKSVAVIVSVLFNKSKRKFSKIGIVDFVGTTPPTLDKTRWSSPVVVVNLIGFSLILEGPFDP